MKAPTWHIFVVCFCMFFFLAAPVDLTATPRPEITTGISISCEIAYRLITLTVLVATIDAQWEGMGDVGSARYELALLPLCPTIRALTYSN